MRSMLSLLVVALAVFTLWWVRQPGEPWQAPSAIPPVVAEWPTAPLGAGVAAFEQTLTRPPFWEERRPLPTAVAPAPSVPQQAPEISILGAVSDGSRVTLIIRDQAGTRRLLPGGTSEGWVFERIEGDHALFVHGGRVEHVAIPRRRVADLPALRTANPVYPSVPPVVPASVDTAPGSAARDGSARQ